MCSNSHNGGQSSQDIFHRAFAHQPELTLAARPSIQEKPPTAAKNTAAIQASESPGILFVVSAAKIVIAAISHMKAIAKQHQ
jgi:hypothetical protein